MSIRRILVVEDEVVIALDLSATIADLGYTVIGPATTIGNALGLIRHAKPHAAVLDWRIHEGNTEIVGDALSALGIPFGFVSAHPPDTVARHHRARPFLRKPFSAPSMNALIRALTADPRPLAGGPSMPALPGAPPG